MAGRETRTTVTDPVDGSGQDGRSRDPHSSAFHSSLIGLIAQWREKKSSLNWGAIHDDDMSDEDHDRCFGLADGYEACANDLELLLKAALPAEGRTTPQEANRVERIFEAVVHTYEGDDDMVPDDLREASFVRRARRFRERTVSGLTTPSKVIGTLNTSEPVTRDSAGRTTPQELVYELRLIVNQLACGRTMTVAQRLSVLADKLESGRTTPEERESK